MKNPYLDLLQLICCDSATIFKTVELENESINIKNTHFWGMDGYSMMSGDHNGVKQFFLGCQCHTLHTSFIETIVLLCVSHHTLHTSFIKTIVLLCVCVIPQYVDFKNFDALLLNLYLLMKNSSIKQEVQNIYGLTSMKLIKVAVNRWLSYGKVAQRILDCYEVLVEALDAIYMRNRKPAVRVVRDDLVNPTTIATLFSC